MRLALDDRMQAGIRREHYDGAPGVLTSGLVWIAAAAVCFALGNKQGVWTLLIGGALIYPISTLLQRIWVQPIKDPPPNALNQLAGASTIWLIACCMMAYGLFHLRQELFFPAMMVTIGCRYTVFATVFGLRSFWILGLTLIAAGFASFYLWLAPWISALLGGVIELAFAGVFFASAKKLLRSG